MSGPRGRVSCQQCGGRHAPREHSVPCWLCRMPTWSHHATCDRCYRFPKIENFHREEQRGQ